MYYEHAILAWWISYAKKIYARQKQINHGNIAKNFHIAYLDLKISMSGKHFLTIHIWLDFDAFLYALGNAYKINVK